MDKYDRETVLTSEEKNRDAAWPLLQVDRVSYRYPQFSLGEISFDLQEGEFLTVVGSNGSGKSTLLKLVSGFLSPSSGRLCLDGRELPALTLAERARRIALVLQESPLSFPLTVLEFILQGRHPHLGWFKLEKSGDREIVRWAMRATDCENFALRRMQELSGGERQRVILARALAQQPRLLLLDEPTLNLDLGYQVEMVHLLKSLSQANHFTVMMVTHELNIAAEFSDQVLLLHHGKALAWGRPETVFEEKSLMEVFNLDVLVDRNPISGAPRITPVNHRSRLFDPRI